MPPEPFSCVPGCPIWKEWCARWTSAILFKCRNLCFHFFSKNRTLSAASGWIRDKQSHSTWMSWLILTYACKILKKWVYFRDVWKKKSNLIQMWYVWNYQKSSNITPWGDSQTLHRAISTCKVSRPTGWWQSGNSWLKDSHLSWRAKEWSYILF